MWFSYSDDDGFVLHKTEDDAKRFAQEAAATEAECAAEHGEWTDEACQVCWGVVSEIMQETLRWIPDDSDTEYVEMKLLPVKQEAKT